MDAKQIYLFLLFSAAMLLSSCSSDSSDDRAVIGKGPELSFDVSDLSRASVTNSINHFVVYGDINHQANNILVPVLLFNKTLVEYKDGSWCYEGTQHWLPKYEHSFVAISPSSVLKSDNSPRYLNSQLSFTYTLPSDRNDVTDILVATHRRLYKDNIIPDQNVTANDATPVTFKFSHLLSLINIASKFDDEMNPEAYIQFRKLELSGFTTKVSCNILPASRESNDQTDDNVLGFNAEDIATAPLTIVFPDPVKIFNRRDYVNLLDANDAIMMLPQAFAADSDAKIRLSYTVNDDPTVRQIFLPLSGKTWESGKSYNYRFTLDRTGLHLDTTTITDWEVLNVGNIDLY